ncbi:MAG: MTAP family purine nucleoside phosphorylase [Planctomycetota bacterium]
MTHTPAPPPTLAIIGGSGLADALTRDLDDDQANATTHTPDTPFGPPSSPITETTWSGTRVLILKRHGPGHTLNPSAVPYRANLFALKALGATHVLASGATGSLREHLQPGQLVLADQFIDKTTKRDNTFYENAAVHAEFSEPCCPVMRRWLGAAADRMPDLTVHRSGTYVCMEGPTFSTKAESEMHRQWGGDLIGMTAMPEARLAREAELAYALIAMPTDYDCWKPHPPDTNPMGLLQEIIGNLQTASANNLALIKEALSDTTLLQEPSPAHDALALGIWSDKSQLDPEEIARLAPLWGRHF